MSLNRILRGTVCIILSLTMLLAVNPFISQKIDYEGYADAATKSEADQVIDEARSYKGLGLRAVEKQMAKKYKKTWNNKYGADWCAWFVSACTYNVNSKKFTGFGTYPENCARGVLNKGGTVIFVNKGWYDRKTNQKNFTGSNYNFCIPKSSKVKYDKNYKPRKGDFFITQNDRSNYYFAHIGFVSKDSNSPSSVKVIDGNGGTRSWPYTIVDERTISSNIVCYVHPNYETAECTHSWDKKGVCTKCKKEYKDCDKPDTSYKTVISSKVYRLKSNANVYYWPNSEGKTDKKATLPKGRFIFVYGKVGNWYKIASSGLDGIGYMPAVAVETYTKSSSPSKVTVVAADFTKKTGAESALLGSSVQSNNPIKSISATVKGKKNLSVEEVWNDSLWTGANLGSANNRVNKSLKQLKDLPAGTYNLTITAKDIFGASGTDTAIITVGGVTPPEITGAASDESIKVTITNKHAGGKTVYSINDGENQEVKNNSATITITEQGETVIRAYTTKDGNKSSVQSFTARLYQLDQPEINVSQQGNKGQITIKSPDSKADIWYKLDEGSYQKYTGPFMVNNGVLVSAYAKKAGTIKSEISTEETEYTEPDAPELKLTNPESTVAVGKTVTVGWQKDWKAETYKVTLYKVSETGDDTSVETIETENPSATFTLGEAGSYYVEAVASNSIGDSEPSNRLEATAKAPLTVEFRDAGTIDEETGAEQGELLTSVLVNYGESPEKVPEPSSKGHSFIGWRNAETGVVSVNGYLKSIVKDNTTYYAEYQKNTYKVRFFDPNGKLIATEKVLFGDAADTADIVKYLKDNKFVTEGKAVTGWSVMKTAEPDSQADISSVDSDMDVQAIVAWEKEDLPVKVTVQSVAIEGTTFRPTIRLTTDETKDTDIYLVASLKGTDANKGAEKTLYSDRRVFVIPKGTTGLTLNGGSHDFDLKVGDSNSANAVTKLEVVALEKKEDDSTGSTYSELATYEIHQENSWTEPSEWSTSEPEAAANRNVESKTQYRYRDQIAVYSGKDSLDGYTKGATETISTTYGAWRISKPSTSDTKGDAYRQQVTVEQQTAQLGYAWYCDCTQVAWKNDGGSCSKCGTKTRNLLEVYSTKAITNYTKDTSDNSYKLPKTVSKSSPDKLGTIYYMRYKGSEVSSFTTKSTSKAVWLWQYASKKTAPVYRTKTVKTRTKFTKWGDWSAWSDTEYTQSSTRQVDTQTLYRYSDMIEAPPAVTDLEGNAVTLEGKLDVGTDLNGKAATIMVYQTNNNDPNKYQMQYTGQIVIGEGNSYSFSFIPNKDPDSETGNYIVTLGIEGLTGLVTVGVVEAPREEHKVEFFYQNGGTEVQIGEPQMVKDGEDADLSVIEVPEREGWSFIGWSQRTTDITEDCRIEATYVPRTNAVVFVDWVNQTIDLRTVETGEPVNLPGAIEGTAGYEFKGWKDEDGNLLTEAIVVTKNRIITAEYEPMKYTVRFLGIDGKAVDTQEVTYGHSAEPPAYEPAEGKFIGWSTIENWWNVEGNVDVKPIVLYTETAMMPVATVREDEESGNRTIEISTEEEGAAIYYTVDGETPTSEMIEEYETAVSTGSEAAKYSGSIIKYEKPLELTEDTAIVAVAYVDGKNESDPCYVYFDPEEDPVEEGESYSDWEEVGTYDVKVKPGNDVTVEVDLEENPGLVGYDFMIEMDKGALYADTDEYDSPVVEAGTVSENGTLNASDADTGLRLFWTSTTKSTATGKLFTATLHADEDAEEGFYPVTVSYAPENTLDGDFESTLLDKVNVVISSAACIELSTLEIKLARESYEYEGRAIEPAVNIEGLKEGEDYTVEYEKNVNVGTAKAIVTGKGSYAGTVEKEFAITKANIANADVEAIPDQRKTGGPVEPELSISYNGNALVKDTDYEAVYANNVEAGTATVTINGIGNFKGTKSVEFEITESLEALLEQALADKAKAEKELADAKKESADAKKQAEDLQKDLDTANAEIARLQAAIDEGSDEVIADLNAQLEEAKRAKTELEGQLTEANKAKADAESKLDEANKAKEAAEKRADDAEKALEEYKQQHPEGGSSSEEQCTHEWNTTYSVDVPATCKAEGSESIHCKKCGAVEEGTSRAIPKTDHSYGAWKTKTPATELATGQRIHTCTVCGNTETQTIAMLAPSLPAVKIAKPKAAKRSATIKWKKVSKPNQKKIAKIQIQYSMDPTFRTGVKTTTAKKSASSKTIKKLASKKTYYVRIRSLKQAGGVTHISAWSAIRKVKAK